MPAEEKGKGPAIQQEKDEEIKGEGEGEGEGEGVFAWEREEDEDEPTTTTTRDHVKRPFADMLAEATCALRDKNFELAVDVLSDATSMRVEEYGSMALECVDVYHKYGKALLAKMQMSGDVLGRAIQAEAEPETAVEVDTEEPSTSTKENEEECEDSQVAWEVLETARLILSKDPNHSLEEADVLITLGDLSLELGNYEQAIGDYARACSLVRERLPMHDRRMLNTHHALAMAYMISNLPEKALEVHKACAEACEARIAKLTEEIEKATVVDPDVAKEMEELREFLPEFHQKIGDLRMLQGETTTGFVCPPSGSERVVHDLGVIKGSKSASRASKAKEQEDRSKRKAEDQGDIGTEKRPREEE